MVDDSGQYCLAFNGEIYNYPDLTHVLEAKGHVFRTRSDTEAIVHAYEEWGDACVQRFRGMFAFAIWDAPRQRLFLARDRYGIKPLYYARVGDLVLFASEIKALMEHNMQKVEEVGAKKVVFTCPSCYHTWKHLYRLPGVELYHSSQMLHQMILDRIGDGTPPGPVPDGEQVAPEATVLPTVR